MFDKDTLDALQQAKSIETANRAFAFSHTSHHVVALPSDFKTHDLEAFLPNRRRARGTMATTHHADFADYVAQHAEDGCSVFVDPAAMKATAILNLGTPDNPGHADNKAQLVAEQTAAYRALLGVANGAGQKQATVAEFLEDWLPYLVCTGADGTDITLPKAVAAVRKVTIESLKKLENAEGQLSASRSAFESVTAHSGADPLPATIDFSCQAYAGLPTRTFRVRLSVITGSDKPAIGLRIVKHEQHVEEMAQELAQLVGDAISKAGCPDMPVLIGTYSATR